MKPDYEFPLYSQVNEETRRFLAEADKLPPVPGSDAVVYIFIPTKSPLLWRVAVELAKEINAENKHVYRVEVSACRILNGDDWTLALL